MTATDSDPLFGVTVDRRAGVLVAVPTGELDLHTVPMLAAQLREQGDCERVVLDLRSLGFMDSSGLRLLVAERERARELGYELAIVRGGPAIERLLQLTRMDQALPFVEADALEL